MPDNQQDKQQRTAPGGSVIRDGVLKSKGDSKK